VTSKQIIMLGTVDTQQTGFRHEFQEAPPTFK